MANSRKISYLEAFQAYQQELELFKERQKSKGKNEFYIIQQLLEHFGVFLIDKADNTILPEDPNVSKYLQVVSNIHFHALVRKKSKFSNCSACSTIFADCDSIQLILKTKLSQSRRLRLVLLQGSVFQKRCPKENENKQIKSQKVNFTR